MGSHLLNWECKKEALLAHCNRVNLASCPLTVTYAIRLTFRYIEVEHSDFLPLLHINLQLLKILSLTLKHRENNKNELFSYFNFKIIMLNTQSKLTGDKLRISAVQGESSFNRECANCTKTFVRLCSPSYSTFHSTFC